MALGLETMYHRAVHQRIFHGLMSIFLAGSPTVFAAVDLSDEGWKLAAVRENNVAIYSRARSGSPLKEFKAVGPIDAPTYAVCAVKIGRASCRERVVSEV